MPNHTKKSPLLSSCSLLMAFIFLYSASVQLNDRDWNFWFPLYAIAFSVNFFLAMSLASKAINHMAQLALWSGVLLFLKVVLEAHLNGLPGILSLDMGQRVVREKIGSGLVVISMLLQSKAYGVSGEPNKAKRRQTAAYVKFGMTTLVAASYGLSAYFFTFVKEDIKF